MELLQGLLRTKSSRFLLVVVFLQSIYVVFFHPYSPSQAEIQRVTTNKHTSTTKILSTNVTIQDFGLMAKQVAALADLADHYVKNRYLDSSGLTELVTEQFPWWNDSTVDYFPWKHKPLYERPVSDLNFFGAKTGIVVCAGDGNAEEAAHLIVFLRDVHKSKLPIDIAYVGDTDLTPRVRQFLSRLADDVSFIDLTKVFDNSLVHLGSYATKPFALLASKYPQTILMDADAVPFSRPDSMFKDYPSLKENGSLFFHDRSMTTENLMRQDWLNKHLKVAGQQSSAHMNYSSLFGRRYIAEEADSAVVCIDKSRPKLYMAMVFACWMNIQEVREAVTWHMFFGEKESYWVAAELTGVPYSFEPWSSARLAVSPPLTVDLTMDDNPESMDWKQMRRTRATDDDLTFEDEASREHKRCTTHMVHATPDGREPLWANGGLWLDKRDRNLGLANWTHRYLGQRIDEAIVDFAPPFTNTLGISVSSDLDQDLQLATIHEEREQVMATQPVWLNGDWGKDADGCPQHDETRWMRLDDAFRAKLEAMIHAVKRTQARYHRELG